MLDKFRKISTSLGMKICLGLLAISLVWSVSSQSGQGQYVAKVAGNYIYKSEFLRAKQHFARAISHEQGAAIDPEALNKFVLDSLIKNALLKAESDKLGLVVGESVVMEEIRRMPVFHDKDGKFDKETFKRLLASNGISESEFIKQRKEDIAASILDSIFVPYDPSQSFVNDFNAYKNQERQVELVTISQSAKPDAGKSPTESDIAAFYQQHKAELLVPETRDISYVIIGLARSKESAKDVLATFKDEKILHELVKKIEDELAGGMTLQEVAKKFGLKVENSSKGVALGQASPSNVPNKILAEAFLLKENQPSDAQQLEGGADSSSAGYFVVNVDKINAAHQKSLDASLKQEIVQAIERERDGKALYEVASKLYTSLSDGRKSLSTVLAENANVSAKIVTLSKVGKQTDLSPALVFDAFGVEKKDGYTHLYPVPGQMAFQFAVVKSIVEPKKLSEQQLATLHEQVSGYMTSAIHHEFLTYLYGKYSVKVYPDSVKTTD